MLGMVVVTFMWLLVNYTRWRARIIYYNIIWMTFLSRKRYYYSDIIIIIMIKTPSKNTIITRICTSRTCWGMTYRGHRKCPATVAYPDSNTRRCQRTSSSRCAAVIRPDTRRTPSPSCLCTDVSSQPSRLGIRPHRRKCVRLRTVWCPVYRGTSTCGRPTCWCTYLDTARVRCATDTRRYLK